MHIFLLLCTDATSPPMPSSLHLSTLPSIYPRFPRSSSESTSKHLSHQPFSPHLTEPTHNLHINSGRQSPHHPVLIRKSSFLIIFIHVTLVMPLAHFTSHTFNHLFRFILTRRSCPIQQSCVLTCNFY